MRRPWLYFRYRFDASVVNSLTLSIPYVTCHSVFINDFKVYNDSVFAEDLWISHDIPFLTLPCVSHDSIFAIDLMRRSWIQWRCGFHLSVVTQFLGMISWSSKSQLSLMIYGSVVTYRFRQFYASAMTVFLLSIWCIGREFFDAVDSTRQLSLSFRSWFQIIRWLCLCWWFMVQPWHSVFDNSIRRLWLHFFYRFHTWAGTQFSVMISSSTVNQFSLTIYG